MKALRARQFINKFDRKCISRDIKGISLIQIVWSKDYYVAVVIAHEEIAATKHLACLQNETVALQFAISFVLYMHQKQVFSFHFSVKVCTA